MKIAITGSTGKLGTHVINMLKEKMPSDDIIALARRPEAAAKMGVEVRLADYDQPDTLNDALKGVDILLLISANEIGKRAKQHSNIIDAAKNRGVKWIVYTSLLHADKTSINLAQEHLETEKMIKASGIPFTILRNGWYTENYTSSVPGAIAGGAFAGSAADGRLSLAARKDYAEAAVAVLTTEGHAGKTYELAGDEHYTLEDLAKEISRQTGKDIPYRNLPEHEYASMLKSFGVPEGFASVLASWDVSASKNDLHDNSGTLSKLIGRKTTPLSESVSEVVVN